MDVEDFPKCTRQMGVSLPQAASHVFMSRLHWVPKCISSLSKVADWDNKDTPTYYLYIYIYLSMSMSIYHIYIYILYNAYSSHM